MIRVLKGDITEARVDAIVNAANESLMPGGGVCGAIHRAAGPELAQECRALDGCAVGEAKITGAYDLPAKYVIHTVGPRWSGDTGGGLGQAYQLARCYSNALTLAAAHGLASIAFPAISTGIFGYPVAEAADVAAGAVAGWLSGAGTEGETGGLKDIRFVCFDRETTDIYARAVEEVCG